MAANSNIFKDFLEYWYFIRYLSANQKKIIFNSLSQQEQKSLTLSCERGGWSDVLNRNIIDEMVDEIKDIYGFDLIDMRYKVLHNESVYVPTDFWEMIEEDLSNYEYENVFHLIGGIKPVKCKKNKNVTLLVKEGVKTNE